MFGKDRSKNILITYYIVKVSSPLLDVSLNQREGSTIYTNIHATLASLIKKYLSKNSVCQNQVRTVFDPENCYEVANAVGFRAN